jgi:NCK-associated protein 1
MLMVQDLRKHWLSILMIVTSSRSSVNIRHLEKATVSTGKEGLVSEGNAAYNWSRCVDELEGQLSKHGSLKKLYFYHQHLTTVTPVLFIFSSNSHSFIFFLSSTSVFSVLASSIMLENCRSSETQCLVQKAVPNIVVRGLEQLAAFQNVLLPLFLKRCIF